MPSTNLTIGGKDGIIRVYITVCWLSEWRLEEVTMIRQPDKKIYLYGRLSHEDELAGDSNSIINQRKILTKYAEDKGLTPYEFIYDDGYSGVDFDRPAFAEMIEEVEDGNSDLFTEDSVEISFPQLSGLKEIELQNKINTLLKEEAFRE